MDKSKALRLLDGVNIHSDVFIISQALAQRQLRESGVNFFQTDGAPGSTGKNLEKFLNLFNRTIYPPNDITLPNKAVIPKAKNNLISVYNTEIAQCYPDKKGGSSEDRSPTKEEMLNCCSQGFLMKELEAISPKLLLLMGAKSRDSFFTFCMKKDFPKSLSVHMEEIIKSKEAPVLTVDGVNIKVLPIQHASGANPSFSKMLKDKDIIEFIQAILEV